MHAPVGAYSIVSAMRVASMSGTDLTAVDDGCPAPKRLKISLSPQPRPLLDVSPLPPPAAHASHDEQPSSSISQRLIELEEQMCRELSLLQFGPPVTHIYNPLGYAAEPHQCYVHSYGNGKKRVLFFGMNPGPFGMAQTGVPFGDAGIARGWLRITGSVRKPPSEHPKRPIHGLACSRSEVSGGRFWGLFKDLCSRPEVFFENCYVHNYCPLCFMGATGKNVTPPELKISVRNSLQEICDRYLLEVVRLLGVEWLVAVGKYAETRARRALRGMEGEVRVVSITHPSPINPAANKDWKGLATSQLAALGLLDIVRCSGAEHKAGHSVLGETSTGAEEEEPKDKAEGPDSASDHLQEHSSHTSCSLHHPS